MKIILTNGFPLVGSYFVTSERTEFFRDIEEYFDLLRNFLERLISEGLISEQNLTRENGKIIKFSLKDCSHAVNIKFSKFYDSKRDLPTRSVIAEGTLIKVVALRHDMADNSQADDWLRTVYADVELLGNTENGVQTIMKGTINCMMLVQQDGLEPIELKWVY